MFQTRVKVEHLKKVISRDFQEQWLEAQIAYIDEISVDLVNKINNARTISDFDSIVETSNEMLCVLRTKILEPQNFISLHKHIETPLMKLLLYFRQTSGCCELTDIPRHILSPRDMYLRVSKVTKVIPRSYLQALAAFCIIETAEIRKSYIFSYLRQLNMIQNPCDLARLPLTKDSLLLAKHKLYETQYAIFNEVFELPRNIQLLPQHICFRFFCIKLYSKFYVTLDENKDLKRAVQFLLGSFVEMNRMWVRMGYEQAMSEREAERRDNSRMQMGTILTDSFNYLSRLIVETDNRSYYCSISLVLHQAKASADPISAATILENLIRHIPMEKLVQELDLLLDTISGVSSGCGAFCLFLERLETYINEVVVENYKKEVEMKKKVPTISNNSNSKNLNVALVGIDTTPLPNNTNESATSLSFVNQQPSQTSSIIVETNKLTNNNEQKKESGNKLAEFNFTFELINDIFAKLCCAAAQLSTVMSEYFEKLRSKPEDNSVAMASLARNSLWSTPINSLLKFTLDIYPMLLCGDKCYFESESTRIFIIKHKKEVMMRKFYDVFDGLCRNLFPYIAETQDYPTLIEAFETYTVAADSNYFGSKETGYTEDVELIITTEKKQENETVNDLITQFSSNSVPLVSTVKIESVKNLKEEKKSAKFEIMATRIKNSIEDEEFLTKILNLPITYIESMKQNIQKKNQTRNSIGTFVNDTKTEENLKIYEESFELLDFFRLQPVKLLIKYFYSQSIRFSSYIASSLATYIINKPRFIDFYEIKEKKAEIVNCFEQYDNKADTKINEKMEKTEEETKEKIKLNEKQMVKPTIDLVLLSEDERKLLKEYEEDGKLILSMCYPLIYTNITLLSNLLYCINIPDKCLTKIISEVVDKIHSDKEIIEAAGKEPQKENDGEAFSKTTFNELRLQNYTTTICEIAPQMVYIAIRNNLFKDVIEITRMYSEFRPIVAFSLTIDSAYQINRILNKQRRYYIDPRTMEFENDIRSAFEELMTTNNDTLIKKTCEFETRDIYNVMYDTISNAILLCDINNFAETSLNGFIALLSKLSTLTSVEYGTEAILFRLFNIANSMIKRSDRPMALIYVARLYLHYGYKDQAILTAKVASLMGKNCKFSDDKQKNIDNDCDNIIEKADPDYIKRIYNHLEPKFMRFISVSFLEACQKKNEEKKREMEKNVIEKALDSLDEIIAHDEEAVRVMNKYNNNDDNNNNNENNENINILKYEGSNVNFIPVNRNSIINDRNIMNMNNFIGEQLNNNLNISTNAIAINSINTPNSININSSLIPNNTNQIQSISSGVQTSNNTNKTDILTNNIENDIEKLFSSDDALQIEPQSAQIMQFNFDPTNIAYSDFTPSITSNGNITNSDIFVPHKQIDQFDKKIEDTVNNNESQVSTEVTGWGVIPELYFK